MIHSQASAHGAHYVKQATATGTGGAVASADFDASKAGIDLLRAGGNAVDAAVAVAATFAEPAFFNSPFAAGLTARYGEVFTEQTGPVLPLNSWIGNATGIDLLPGGRFQAVAEPVRSGGGSALVVNPD